MLWPPIINSSPISAVVATATATADPRLNPVKELPGRREEVAEGDPSAPFPPPLPSTASVFMAEKHHHLSPRKDSNPDAFVVCQKTYLSSRSTTFQNGLDSGKSLRRQYFPDESKRPKVVLYSTSLRGIRRTFEDCRAVRAILLGFRVAVDERDVSMDATYRRELQLRLAMVPPPFSLPQVFIGSRWVGGADEIQQMHEAGELGRVLEGVAGQDPSYVCSECGGVRFTPCWNCSGSRKVFVEEEERMRRCEECNENGLVRCPNCCL